MAFLDLPAELRMEIYEYISLQAGVFVARASKGTLISPSPISLVCRQLHEEYKNIMYKSAPIVTAYIHEFDFEHVQAFLNSRPQELTHGPVVQRSNTRRQLRLILHLTPACRDEMQRLREWVLLAAEHGDSSNHAEGISHTPASFSTRYFVKEPSPLAPEHSKSMKMLCRTVTHVMDVVYEDWFLSTATSPLKVEIGKLCDCFSQLEARVQPVPW